MGVLGHNGAGKTTLINILTGVLSPDESEDTEIIINRQSITKIDEIRKFIGLCAQFDILWQEITAYQHLHLFASLKGIPAEEIESAIIDLLEMVGLSKETHNKVGGFSGGMKRRLSLAMAAIGNPKIILLDEPTTGLDPKVRQQVWSLIQQLKANRSIILTTHSMEEADVLADRVCVMVKGRVRCIGTSVFLKQH
jgi:ABC-type multidrug transport system ATPase subunit